MQDIVLIDDKEVIVRCGEKTNYVDTRDNFELDSGIKLDEKTVDYNRTMKSCWIDGKAFQKFPNDEFESLLNNVQVYIQAKENREQIAEEQKEAERIANMTEEEKAAQTQVQLTAAVQNVLDSEAQKLNYDSCLSVCSYVDTGVSKFDDEGKAFRAWRSAVWAKGYEILDEVIVGKREIPTEEELLAELPKLTIVYSE